MSEQNSGDDRQALKIAVASLVIAALLGVALMLFLPLLGSFVDQHFSAGMGLKDAAVVAFFTTVVTLLFLPWPLATAYWASCSLCSAASLAFFWCYGCLSHGYFNAPSPSGSTACLTSATSP